MIPTIGIMIGGYICFRCVEIACRNDSQFGSKAQHVVVSVLAMIGLIVTSVLTFGLIESGASAQQGLGGLLK